MGTPNFDNANVPTEPPSTGCVEFGPFRLDAARRKLWRGDELIQLPPKALDLLIALTVARGGLVQKNELMHRLWPDTFVSDESLTQCVSALRRALGDDPSHPQFISTIPKRGYRFVAPIADSASAQEPSPVRPPDLIPRLRPVAAQSGAATLAFRPAAQASPFRRRVAQTVAALVVLAAVLVFAVRMLSGPATEAPPAIPMRFVETAPPGTIVVSGGALSPDGHSLAYLARDLESRVTSLWVRDLRGTAAQLLAGTTGATRPFWAPDSRAIGFFSDGKLRTIDLATSAVQTLANVGPMPVGGSWSSRGVIVFSDRRSNLFAVPVTGGTPYAVTTLNRKEQESAHRYPYFLPDGDHFLYYANSPDLQRAGTYLTSLTEAAQPGTPPQRVLDASSGGTVYAEPGYLLHVRDRELLADPFNPQTGRTGGPPIELAAGVESPQIINQAFISVSSAGVVAYGGGQASPRLVWFDDQGQRLSAISVPADLHNPALSPDGGVLAQALDAERRGTWSLDRSGGAASWLVREGGSPMASPDGQHLFFTSTRGTGIADIYARGASGTSETLLYRSSEPKTVTDLTNDGLRLVFTSSDAMSKEDIWVLPLANPASAQPFLRTEHNEMQGEVSPDGRWMAYASDESGRWEVYVQKFPEGGWKRAISTAGGAEPHWRNDGHRLFYLASDQRVMAVDVISPATAQMGRPRALFVAPLSTDLPSIFRNQYAVTPDGTRFLVDAFEGMVEPITMLVNWASLPKPARQVAAR